MPNISIGNRLLRARPPTYPPAPPALWTPWSNAATFATLDFAWDWSNPLARIGSPGAYTGLVDESIAGLSGTVKTFAEANSSWATAAFGAVEGAVLNGSKWMTGDSPSAYTPGDSYVAWAAYKFTTLAIHNILASRTGNASLIILSGSNVGLYHNSGSNAIYSGAQIAVNVELFTCARYDPAGYGNRINTNGRITPLTNPTLSSASNTVYDIPQMGTYNSNLAPSFVGVIGGGGRTFTATGWDNAEMRKMEGWGSWHYWHDGSKLEIGHPYKNSPPTQ